MSHPSSQIRYQFTSPSSSLCTHICSLHLNYSNQSTIMTLHLFLSIFLMLTFFVFSTKSESFIGVNYGVLADNLPPPEETAKLLKGTSIEKVRLYGADPGIIKALGNSGKGIVIGTTNNDIPKLASDPNYAGQWVGANVLAFYPASKVIVVTVGNEIFSYGGENLISQLVPAMQNVQNALDAASVGGKIKVSTVHSMAVLGQSDPPSSGAFATPDTMKGLLEFLKSTGSPFMINPYPYFAYQSDSRPETLSFCLFQPNAGRVDSRSGIKYMNMFDAQVDSVRSALNSVGYKDVEIVVAETGWPYKGGPTEVGATVENAKAYNGNLINHLRSMVGTPLMPGKSVDTYIFALYDENLKPGAMSEHFFGLFKPDLSAVYDIGLSKNVQAPIAAPMAPEPSAPDAPAPTTTETPATPLTPETPETTVPTPAIPTVTPATQSPKLSGKPGITASATPISCRPPLSQLIFLVIMVASFLVVSPEGSRESSSCT